MDGGACTTGVIVCFIAYIIGILIITVRRSDNYTKSDYIYFKYGILINIFSTLIAVTSYSLIKNYAISLLNL